MEASNITYLGAFVAGILSFLSPCVLPLIPSFITYITGLSFADLQAEHPTHKVRQQTIIHTLLFIAGFTVVFVLLGASATFIGGLMQEHMTAIRRIGGLLIVLFGVHLTGLFPIKFLLGEKRIAVHRKPVGYVGSFLVGLAFAAGWTPCIGPILASILMVAAAEETVLHGIALLLTYSMGLAIPFFLAALAMHQFLVVFNRFKKYIRIFEIVTGVFLIIVGVMVFTNYLTVLSRYTTIWFGE
ncbi:cytochrome c biogenesis CcdA family protein [Geobacter sp. AOG1]|uniref:cytochrome c biogenesis CcdA family protein n=1 Tax=Geobacter sp. AOG1 TaxID=1566346 RepID=UPI001CC55965|nr:cytochrome c biogenesis protein CcdA [Geobacter sp. AOG1]GFE59406.1 cytochrome C biogenesis protein CcdA [Geobacter sp. AOG1]